MHGNYIHFHQQKDTDLNNSTHTISTFIFDKVRIL